MLGRPAGWWVGTVVGFGSSHLLICIGQMVGWAAAPGHTPSFLNKTAGRLSGEKPPCHCVLAAPGPTLTVG